MTNIFLEGQMIASINLFTLCPFIVSKFILQEWLKYIQHTDNHFQHSLIRKIVRNQAPAFDYQSALSALQLFFKLSKKSGLTGKHVSVLLRQSTLLNDEISEVILSLYESFLSNDGSSELSSNRFTDLKWSAIGLRQTQDKQQPNKLYMKVELQMNGKQQQLSKTVSMTLLQFKLLSEQVGRMSSLVGV